jgi:hypothetical protein
MSRFCCRERILIDLTEFSDSDLNSNSECTLTKSSPYATIYGVMSVLTRAIAMLFPDFILNDWVLSIAHSI